MGERERTSKDYRDARTANIIASKETTSGFLGSLHFLAIFTVEDFCLIPLNTTEMCFLSSFEIILISHAHKTIGLLKKNTFFSQVTLHLEKRRFFILTRV
jgi:hypothetical protein